MLEIKKNGL